MTQQTDRTGRAPSARRRLLTVVVAVVLLAAVGGVAIALTRHGSGAVSATSASSTSTATAATPTGTTPSATSSSTSASTSTADPAGTTVGVNTATTGSGSSPSASSGTLVPEPLTSAVRQQLVADYVRDKHYQSSWISGTRPGSVYYVLDTSTGNHLAWGDFQITSAAPTQVQIDSQDGGSSSALVQRPGGSWQLYDICTTPRFLALVGPLPEGRHC